MDAAAAVGPEVRPVRLEKRRLDHAIVVDEIVAVGLIDCAVDAPADLRHYLNVEILVLKNDDAIRL